jgi:hypothetical protein
MAEEGSPRGLGITPIPNQVAEAVLRPTAQKPIAPLGALSEGGGIESKARPIAPTRGRYRKGVPLGMALPYRPVLRCA